MRCKGRRWERNVRERSRQQHDTQRVGRSIALTGGVRGVEDGRGGGGRRSHLAPEELHFGLAECRLQRRLLRLLAAFAPFAFLALLRRLHGRRRVPRLVALLPRLLRLFPHLGLLLLGRWRCLRVRHHVRQLKPAGLRAAAKKKKRIKTTGGERSCVEHKQTVTKRLCTPCCSSV